MKILGYGKNNTHIDISHVAVEPDNLLRVQRGHGSPDDRAPVAALHVEALVTESLHQVASYDSHLGGA